MRAPQNAGISGAASLRRMATVSLLSIPMAVEIVVGEALFIGHVIFLIETLGFAWGLVAFTAIWAALGLAILAVIDVLWPRVEHSLNALRSRVSQRFAEIRQRIPIWALLAVLGTAGLAAGAALVITLAGSEIVDWTADHRGDVGVFLILTAVITLLLNVIVRLGRGLESWVRRIADTAGPLLRSFATLLSMILLGPAMAWLLFRLLRFSRRSVYALTLASAPVFAAFWVPFYGLGVWGLVEGLF